MCYFAHQTDLPFADFFMLHVYTQVQEALRAASNDGDSPGGVLFGMTEP